MQTLSVEIQDNYIQNFMDYIKENSAYISISKEGRMEVE
jgi:hypothetical protein